MKKPNALRAVVQGHLMVTLPVVLFIALFGLIGWYLRGVGALFIGMFIGAILAWPLWALLVPRWRDWVEDSGLKGSDVQRLAALTFLVWPEGSIFERTEFKRRNGKRGWSKDI